MTKLEKELRRLIRVFRPSPAERKFAQVMGYWFFITNTVRREYKVRGFVIDYAIPSKKIAIEIDGHNYHGGRRDIIKDMALKDEGWLVYRIQAKELWQTPHTVRKYIKLFVRNPHKYLQRYGWCILHN